MYNKEITALTLAAAALLPFANALVLPRQDDMTCQTSSGSPKSANITDVINQLTGQGCQCPPTNHEASDYTTLVHHNSARISICGNGDEPAGGYDYVTVTGYATQIQQACLNDGLAGGTYTISPSTRVEVW